MKASGWRWGNEPVGCLGALAAAVTVAVAVIVAVVA